MNAGGRWAYFRDHGKLGAGARVTVQQAIEHAGPGGFADRGRNSGYLRVEMLNIHTFMLSEVSMSRKPAIRAAVGPPLPERRRNPTVFEGSPLYICASYDRIVQASQMGGKLGAIQTTFEYKELPCFIMPSCSWSLP